MFPTGKEKKKSKKRSLDRAQVWCGLVLFSVYPLISQMGLPLCQQPEEPTCPSHGSLLWEQVQGQKRAWRQGISGHHFELKSRVFW